MMVKTTETVGVSHSTIDIIDLGQPQNQQLGDVSAAAAPTALCRLTNHTGAVHSLLWIAEKGWLVRCAKNGLFLTTFFWKNQQFCQDRLGTNVVLASSRQSDSFHIAAERPTPQSGLGESERRRRRRR